MRAIDTAGNVDSTPATHAWTIDLAPDTSIDFGPDDPTTQTTASFVLSSNEAGVEFQCALDVPTFSSCVTPLELTNLAPGLHELRVRARDLAGNVDETPDTYRWTILPPPTTTITTMPAEVTADTTADFRFESNHVDATFMCSLDGLEPTPCSSPQTYTDLGLGSHEFEVFAVGVEGNADPTPATWGWDVGDDTPPVVRIDAGPPPATEDTTITFEISVDDPAADMLCSLDGATPTVCTSPVTYGPAELSGNGTRPISGEHTFELTAVKQHLLVDLTPVTLTWRIDDLTAPETTIENGPAAEIPLETPALFVFSSNELDAEFECALDPDPLAGPQWSSCASPPENTYEIDALPGDAPAARARDRPERQRRRDAGRVPLDGRRAAGRDHHVRARRRIGDQRDLGDVRVLRRPGRRDLPVHARRRRDRVHVAGHVREPRRGRPLVRGLGHEPVPARLRPAGERRLDDRRAARHDRPDGLDRLRPAGLDAEPDRAVRIQRRRQRDPRHRPRLRVRDHRRQRRRVHLL